MPKSRLLDDMDDQDRKPKTTTRSPLKGFHPKTKKLLARLRGDAPVCIACNDTGKNSRGGNCYPCLVHGRL